MDPNEFMVKMLEAFPNAIVGQDNDGQLIVYTNMKEENGVVVDLDDPNLTGV